MVRLVVRHRERETERDLYGSESRRVATASCNLEGRQYYLLLQWFGTFISDYLLLNKAAFLLQLFLPLTQRRLLRVSFLSPIKHRVIRFSAFILENENRMDRIKLCVYSAGASSWKLSLVRSTTNNSLVNSLWFFKLSLLFILP